ncbi:M23 family metallopeptidase [Sphingomonas sp. ERG5]|uniref:M23 family metallopeptidase n=1 Tax=Sphingomonas sp. ERG5 TaxID=1381597 RepID=UPI00054C719C|nr:M23 family metallopeptidase [Sphingomonas sp. ERG5]
MRKLGSGLLIAFCVVVGLWVAVLVVLPDAPPAAAPPSVMPEATRPVVVTGTTQAVLAIPVAGVPREQLRDNWGDPRDNGQRAHHGTDIAAPANTPVLAAASGAVEKLWTSAAGGTTVYVRSPGRGWIYYYAHLSGYAPGLHEGQGVKTGDPLGFVGDTGNAGAGNYHLHFGLTRTTPEQHWYEGQDVDPYPYLAGKPASR